MINLSNSIYWGETQHCRFSPRRHVFRYPMFFLCLELSELSTLNSTILSYNRKALFALHDRDYLRNRNGAITSKFLELLKSAEILTVPHKTYLLTLPRCLGYVFNPVNFFISTDRENNLHSLVAEVSNTFGEVHTYVLPALICELKQPQYAFRFPKHFYVSPFLETGGYYELSLRVSPGTIRINVDLEQNGLKVLSASLAGSAKDLTEGALLKSLFCFPLACVGTIMRIQWQAFQLIFFRQAKIYLKPYTLHPNTFKYKFSWLHSVRVRVLQMLKLLVDRNNKNENSHDPIS